MWAYRLEGPLRFARHDIPEPGLDDVPDGSVVLRFRAGGICGSDIARCFDGGSPPVPAHLGCRYMRLSATSSPPAPTYPSASGWWARMMEKDVILDVGRTPQAVRRQAMIRSQAYAERYPGMMKSYVTHVLPLDRLQDAYELAARPAVGRLKVILQGRRQNAEH